MDKNGKYNKPPDVPLTPGARLALVNLGKSKNRLSSRQTGCDILDDASVGASGDAEFFPPVEEFAAGDLLALYYWSDCWLASMLPEPFYSFEVNLDLSFPPVPPILVDYQTTTVPAEPTETQPTLPSGATTTEITTAEAVTTEDITTTSATTETTATTTSEVCLGVGMINKLPG